MLKELSKKSFNLDKVVAHAEYFSDTFFYQLLFEIQNKQFVVVVVVLLMLSLHDTQDLLIKYFIAVLAHCFPSKHFDLYLFSNNFSRFLHSQ